MRTAACCCAAGRWHRACRARTRALFEATFREYGLPLRVRTDNGVPFAATGAGGLSKLAIWWIKLGITPERIDRGQPSQNGRHERLHRTLEEATARPPAANLRVQQQRFDAFRQEYNELRPHEALGQQPPSHTCQPSPRAYPSRLEEPSYPTADQVRRVRHNGEIRWSSSTTSASQSQRCGRAAPASSKCDWMVDGFAHVDIPASNPLPTTTAEGYAYQKVLRMCSVQSVTHVSGRSTASRRQWCSDIHACSW